jgi:hypothetical protein
MSLSFWSVWNCLANSSIKCDLNSERRWLHSLSRILEHILSWTCWKTWREIT